MKYTRENIKNYKSTIPENMELFWGHRPHPSGKLTNSCFSQWWICEFTENDIVFNCAEQYMMYHKAMLFNDTVIAAKVLAEKDPSQHKKLGRKVRNFDPKKWFKHRYNIVLNGNLLKFSQNPELEAYLLATGDKILVEASPYDDIWGVKIHINEPDARHIEKWKGLNLLGFALTEAKEILRARK